jgi:hypothetical protein
VPRTGPTLLRVPEVTAFVGVYHANGDLLGELAYWIGARVGRAHCALCDITHGTFRRKSAWTSCEQALPVPFSTCHLDDRPDDVRSASDGTTPCVLARTDTGQLVVVAGPDALESCDGDPDALIATLRRGCDLAGLVLPSI